MTWNTTTSRRLLLTAVALIGLSISPIAFAQSVTPACPLVQQEGRIIAEFDGEILRSDMDSKQAVSKKVSATIDAGIYDVTFVSYDRYVSRNEDEQDNERWSVILTNSDGVTSQTNATTDLPDGVDEIFQTETINNFILAEDSTGVIAFHAAFPSTGVNNIVPLCVAFDVVTFEETIVENEQIEETFETNVVEKVTEPEVDVSIINIVDDKGQCAFVTENLGVGKTNTAEEVYKLQAFLNVFENENLSINGKYDQSTINAVIDFQEKYTEDTLLPWGLNTGTGYVGITTKHKINELYCGESLEYTEDDLAYMSMVNANSAQDNTQTETVVMNTEPTDVVIEVTEPAATESESVVEDVTVKEEVVAEDTVEVVVIDESEKAHLLDDIELSSEVFTLSGDDATEEDEEKDDNNIVAYADPKNPAGGEGIQQTAAVIVGFVDKFSLPILIVLVMLLSVQIYALWREPKEQQV